MYDFSQEFPKALATVIFVSIVMWLGGKLRKRGKDTGTVRPEAPKEKRRNHELRWLLWWKIEPEELQKNIVEYDRTFPI